MSLRHTRPQQMDPFGLNDGSALVPSMGWVGSVMPGGRHRRRADYTDEPFHPTVTMVVGRWWRHRSGFVA